MTGRRIAAISLAALTCFSIAWQTSFAAWPFTGKTEAPNSDGMKWQPTLEDAMRAASQSNKLILVHFWAPWCKECTRLERDVLSQKKVQEGVNARFVPFKLNADDYPTTVKQYGVDRLPTDLVITSTGQIVGRLKCPIEPDAYLAQLNTVANGASQATGVATNPIGTAPQVSYGTPVQTAAPVMTNPSSALQPPASAVATQPAQQAAPSYPYSSPAASAAPAAANTPAVPAYGNDRYSEYYQRFGAAQSAAPAVQAAGSPNYTAPSAAAQYNPPPASGIQYNSPQTQAPAAAVNWPANQQGLANPAVPAATGPSIVGMPSATITGVGAMGAPSAVGNVPSLGLDGYCPVTLADQKKWQVGDRRYGVIHRGRTYLFAGPVEQQKFLANPDHYSPAISGEDVVMAIDQGQVVEGKRQYGVEYQNRTYLFASDASRRAFSQNPQRYVTEVLQAENIRNSTVR